MSRSQIAWAYSEHGSVLACASKDGIISIWSQQQPKDGQPGLWTQTASLEDSLEPITSMQFAPKQLGLQLAAASEDGFVRFYQANKPLHADGWQLSNDLQVTSHHCTQGLLNGCNLSLPYCLDSITLSLILVQ